MQERIVCPICMKEMRYKDTRKRIVIFYGGIKKTRYVDRYRCEFCHIIRTKFPDSIIPNIRYAASVVQDVLDGVTGPDDDISCYGPSAATIKRWLSTFNHA